MDLEACQRDFYRKPNDAVLRNLEKDLLQEYIQARKIEEESYRQKDRVEWLKSGDQNSQFFFRSLNSRRNRKKLYSITKQDGVKVQDPDGVKSEVLDFYTNLLVICFFNCFNLINRMPTALLQLKSPYEALFNTKPNYEKLRIFGCVCYVYDSRPGRSKLDPKSIRCIFLGYSRSQKGYRCYSSVLRICLC